MSFPNVTLWSHLLTTIGIEVCGVAALGFVAQLFFRSAVWQRAVWQMTVVCLLLLPASEWTGFGRGAAGFLFGQKQVVENIPTSGFTVFKSVVASGPVTAKLQLSPAMPHRALWWPAWVWLAGAAIVLGRMAAAQVLLLALRLRRKKITSQSLRDRVASVAKSVGLRRKVSLLRMPESISPMAFGIFRPSIGLPPGFETKLSATEQEAVLAHELAHLAAMDPLWFLLADLASAWLWWHPLAWWVRRSLHGAARWPTAWSAWARK
jgi:beta-lactamase regulating signal transducer with metallopeptidase domain